MIEVNFSALVVVLVVFSLVLVLERLFFEPLARTMEIRRERSASAERLWSEASRQVEAAATKLREATSRARSEGYQDLDRARAEAEAERSRRVGSERESARDELSRGRESLRQQGDRAVAELESEADRLAAEIASRLLGRPVA